MKVGILADTHIRGWRTLPGFVWDALDGADMILHAGDIMTENVLEDLETIAPVVAVQGNGDWLLDLPTKEIVTCGKITIGITHGHLGKGGNTPERAYSMFAHDNVDIVVFGHSHIPFKSAHGGVMLFNPGSPTERRGQPHFSLGILTIEDNIYDIEHIFF